MILKMIIALLIKATVTKKKNQSSCDKWTLVAY